MINKKYKGNQNSQTTKTATKALTTRSDKTNTYWKQSTNEIIEKHFRR